MLYVNQVYKLRPSISPNIIYHILEYNIEGHQNIAP